jgi:hypothetical protein
MLASALAVAGLPMAVTGGWLFFTAGKGGVRCSHQAAGVCSQGFVLLNASQLLGGASALAGIALVFTALFLALR